MKFNLKSLKALVEEAKGKGDFCEVDPKFLEWLECFEKELKEKLEGIEFVLKDSPLAPWFLGVKDTIKDVLGE